MSYDQVNMLAEVKEKDNPAILSVPGDLAHMAIALILWLEFEATLRVKSMD